MSRTHVPVCPSRPKVEVTLVNGSVSRSQVVLVDSGADTSLMDTGLARELLLDTVCLPKPLEATALDGRRLW